jgi:uncharacterized DUF497 family protein
MRIDWDERKARSNLAKRGLAFSLAEFVLADPLVVCVFDRVERGEERWHTFGMVRANCC